MDTEKKILINIIGTGYDVCVGEVSPEQLTIFNVAVNQEKQSLYHLLFDEDFYKKYLITKTEKSGRYTSWKDFKDTAVFRGANLAEYGQLEIWINRKRIKTYKFHELISNATLFPLFDSEETSLFESENGNTQIIVGFQEKGHLAKYIIKTVKFLPEELKFHIFQFKSSKSTIKLLYKITYLGIPLKSFRNDTVVTGTTFTLL